MANEPLTDALRELLPESCLPPEFESHQELADALTMRLAGSLALIPKEQYDGMVEALRGKK